MKKDINILQMKILFYFSILFSLYLLVACETDETAKQQAEEDKIFDKYIEENLPDSISDGVYRIQVKTGVGEFAEKGSTVSVTYIGKVLQNDKKKLEAAKAFDSKVNEEEPFSFILGNNEVIAGWDEGLLGLREGDRVELIIHSKKAYKGIKNGVIEPYTSLWFDITILSVAK